MQVKRRWRRRTYYLNRKEISSQQVLGSLHKARKNKDDTCAACLKEIKAGQEYIAILTYDPYIFHKKCWLEDHFVGQDKDYSLILAVGTKTFWRFGSKRTSVICKDFTKQVLERARQ